MFRASPFRLAFAAVAVVGLAALAGAVVSSDPDDAPPPVPRLRAVDGRVLFASDFRKAASLADWSPDRAGVWTLARGALRARLPDKKQTRSLIYAGSEAWGEYAVDLDVCQTRGVDKGIALRVRNGRGVGVDLRGPGYHDVLLHLQELPLVSAPVHNDNDIWHHLRVEALDRRYRVFVDGKLVLDKADRRGLNRHGRIGLAAYTGGIGRCTVYYGNVMVTTLR